MAFESVKTGGLALDRNGRERSTKHKPKGGDELLLVLALVVLLLWALYVAIDGTSWVAIGHTIEGLLTAIW